MRSVKEELTGLDTGGVSKPKTEPLNSSEDMKSSPMDTSQPSGITPVPSPAQLKPPRSKKSEYESQLAFSFYDNLESL